MIAHSQKVNGINEGRMKVKVFLKNLYGINNGSKAYFRKQGDGCFDFVWEKQFASELTADEVENIMSHKDWYMKQHNANEMLAEANEAITWIKWFQYGDSGLINFGQMPIRDVAENLKKFEHQASKVLKETASDHVVYGLKVYCDNGSLDCVKFYMEAMSDDDFQKNVATLQNCTVYALHRH